MLGPRNLARARRALLFASVGALASAGLAGCDSGSSPDAPKRGATPRADAAARAAAAPGVEDWNDAGIAWTPYRVATELARRTNRPLCVVVHAGWCPHCRNYSAVFRDARVVEAAKGFVMVRIDADADYETASRFAPDGGYVPRTLFAGPDGTLDAEIHADRASYRWFFDEHDPASVLAGMRAALAKHRG